MLKTSTMQVDSRHKRIKDVEALMLGAFNKTIPLGSVWISGMRWNEMG